MYAGRWQRCAEALCLEDRNGAPGTRNEFLAAWHSVVPEGSDHDDYDSSTMAVPSLYLRDWPDIYIHTNHDTLEQMDSTKLRRVALLGAASGYTYAALDAGHADSLLAFFGASQGRLAEGFKTSAGAHRRHSTGAAGGMDEARTC